eukprot:scaffold9074_cov141-Amphora_coffeaeformis.AAC.1
MHTIFEPFLFAFCTDENSKYNRSVVIPYLKFDLVFRDAECLVPSCSIRINVVDICNSSCSIHVVE